MRKNVSGELTFMVGEMADGTVDGEFLAPKLSKTLNPILEM